MVALLDAALGCRRLHHKEGKLVLYGFDSYFLVMIPTLEILKENLFKFPVDFNSMSMECINFPSYKDRDGYGQFQFRHNGLKYNIQAHRAVYSIHYHERLKQEDVILHTCDNPACVNILHLKKGSHEENVQDRVNKNRSAVGTKNGRYRDGKHCKKYQSFLNIL